MKTLAWIAIALVAFIVVVAAFNWRWVVFGSAVASSESRPSLLTDAKWDDPNSATRFYARFHPGTPSIELRRWLESHRFEHVGGTTSAERRIQAIPCSERIEIEWAEDEASNLQSVQVTIFEAGCL